MIIAVTVYLSLCGAHAQHVFVLNEIVHNVLVRVYDWAFLAVLQGRESDDGVIRSVVIPVTLVG
jgi:hypothetical protein